MRFWLILLCGLSIAVSTQAVVLPPVPTEPIYFEPPVKEMTDDLRKQSCQQLDEAINQLQPFRYSYKPDFYQDGTNQLATAMITADIIPILNGLVAMGYLGYSALVSEKEARRTLLVEQDIAALQRVKSEKHCYE